MPNADETGICTPDSIIIQHSMRFVNTLCLKCVRIVESDVDSSPMDNVCIRSFVSTDAG